MENSAWLEDCLNSSPFENFGGTLISHIKNSWVYMLTQNSRQVGQSIRSKIRTKFGNSNCLQETTWEILVSGLPIPMTFQKRNVIWNGEMGHP